MRNHVVSAKTVLVVIVAMIAQVLFGVAAPANAQTPVSDNQFDTIATLPDGRAAVRGCSSTQGVAYDSFGSGSSIGFAVDVVAGYDWVGGCNQDSIASDGTVVFAAGITGSNNGRILAYKNDTYIWPHDIEDLCDNKTSAVQASISADNRVFYTIASNCVRYNGTELVTLDLATGSELSHVTLDGVSGGSPHVRSFIGGYVYVTDAADEVVYLDSNGNKDTSHSFSPTYAMSNWRQLWSVGAHGELAILSTETGNGYCSGGSSLGQTIVVLRDFNGTETIRTVADDPYNEGCRSQSINITPTGGAVLGLVDQSGSTFFVGFVDKNPSVPVKVVATSDDQSVGGGVVSVDVYGNALYAMGYKLPDGDYYSEDQVRFTLYGPSGTAISQMNTVSLRVSEESFTLVVPSYAATSNGAVHAILRRAGEYEVFTIPFAKIGIDYPRGVLLGDTSTPPELLNYVAMGDSYSSGEGVEPYIDGTDDDPSNTCHRSEGAYPMLLEGYASLSIEVQDFVACSGAETKHIIQEINEDNVELPQAAFITPNTDVVTISIGGNDVGFGAVLSQCTTYDDPDKDSHTLPQEHAVEEANCLSYIADADALIDTPALQAKLANVFEGLKDIGDAYGNSGMKLVVVGYPQLYPEFNDIQETCTWGPWGAAAYGAVSGRDVSGYEVAYLRAATEKLNLLLDGIVTAMSDSDISFVDPQTAFSSHELCTTTPYVLPVVPDAFDPIGRRASFHPNQLGQKAYAGIVAKKISSMLQ